ncbi:hypothetical protein FNF31_04351 [Cafeteria roenbergensis]|uniref:Fungal lipase-type domain-containing protein n=2 Tax=Cafeteria roenbergensis TaxID=33653 RepID=A0A5A8CQC7_CAFRO|nr:hypothetical protein FNF28_06880 [Cafeteria roenbergensis]KAA0160334.1 hypothetical protein FNF31_04351 [Cafeteria roenbergensis]
MAQSAKFMLREAVRRTAVAAKAVASAVKDSRGAPAEEGDASDGQWDEHRQELLASMVESETSIVSALLVALRTAKDSAAWACPGVIMAGALWQIHCGGCGQADPSVPPLLRLPAAIPPVDAARVVEETDARVNFRMCTLSRAIYAKSAAEFARAAQLEPSSVVAFWRSSWSRLSRPTFAIVLDPGLRTIVLVVRGTKATHDVLADIAGNAEAFMGGLAHTGMLRVTRALLGGDPELDHDIAKAAEAGRASDTDGQASSGAGGKAATEAGSGAPLEQSGGERPVEAPASAQTAADVAARPRPRPRRLVDVLQSLVDDRPGWFVGVAGHSLGAGVAALATMRLAGRLRFGPEAVARAAERDRRRAAGGFSPSSSLLHGHAFACPACVSQNLARRFGDSITCFVVGDDPVPLISLRAMREYQERLLACSDEWEGFVDERLRGTWLGASLSTGRSVKEAAVRAGKAASSAGQGVISAAKTAASGLRRAAGSVLGRGEGDPAKRPRAQPTQGPAPASGAVAVADAGEAPPEAGPATAASAEATRATQPAGAGEDASAGAGAATGGTGAGSGSAAVASDAAGTAPSAAAGSSGGGPGSSREGLLSALTQSVMSLASSLAGRRAGGDRDAALGNASGLQERVHSQLADAAAEGERRAEAEGKARARGSSGGSSGEWSDDVDSDVDKVEVAECSTSEPARSTGPSKGGPADGAVVAVPGGKGSAHADQLPLLVLPGRAYHLTIPARPKSRVDLERAASEWYDQWTEAILTGDADAIDRLGVATTKGLGAEGQGRRVRAEAASLSGWIPGKRQLKVQRAPEGGDAAVFFWERACGGLSVSAAAVEPGEQPPVLAQLRFTLFSSSDHRVPACLHCLASLLEQSAPG